MAPWSAAPSPDLRTIMLNTRNTVIFRCCSTGRQSDVLMRPAVPALNGAGKTPEETQNQNTGRQKRNYLKNCFQVLCSVCRSLKWNGIHVTEVQTRPCLAPYANSLPRTSKIFSTIALYSDHFSGCVRSMWGDMTMNPNLGDPYE